MTQTIIKMRNMLGFENFGNQHGGPGKIGTAPMRGPVYGVRVNIQEIQMFEHIFIF